MDRKQIFPGQIPLETDLLGTNKNVMIALGKLSAAVFGTASCVNGLTTGPNSPAALNVVVQPGELYSLQNIDGTAYSSIAADTTHQIVKQGVLLDTTTLSTPAPATAGFSINYLIQAAFSEVDTDAVVLPYYNATNPTQAYSGPANAGTTNNTTRKDTIILSAKAGIAATTGTQVTPSADAGYIGLYVVTVANGQTTVTAPNITQLATAPIIPAGIIPAIQSGSYGYAVDTGAANTYQVAYSPAITALTDGMVLKFRAKTANTSASTFAPNGLTASPIVTGEGHSALQGGEIVSNGDVWLQWNSAIGSGSWVLVKSTGAKLSRIRLNGNITFHVSTTGSDSANSGLSSGSPFATIQHAVDTAHEKYDLNGYTATIQVADGTYSAGILVNNPFVGGGFVNVVGNLATPSNCIISLASGSCLQAQYGVVIGIGGFKLTTASGSSLLANNAAQINVNGAVEFGAASVAHMTASFRGSITITSNYTISGAAPAHWGSSGNSAISAGGQTVTLTGTPAITYMAAASALGYISCPGMTFTGSATGSRYTCISNGVVDTNGAATTYLPGNSSGATATGGQYV